MCRERLKQDHKGICFQVFRNDQERLLIGKSFMRGDHDA
ncbi:Hypothetical Protein U712_02215 [Bacillus subtilis PY79]|nr:Hypothetical Protein U712_02215 [Bacillus subtilis PY79]AKN12524.1 hypothetical protein ABU16_1448 [Bacillus subtilis]EME04951.1 hypothetical protein BS732_4272 [Bacillus subtilis MB73/2]KZD78942.1 hypothetical protein B4417_2861 [Bacillus subtilis]